MKNYKIFIIIFIVSFCSFTFAVKNNYKITESKITVNDASFSGEIVEKNESKANNFLVNDETFKFDGIKKSLKLLSKKPVDNFSTWEFIYAFDSSKAGFGNRSGQMLLQVITSHTAKIVIKDGEVISGIIDDVWDMMNEREINQDTIKEYGEKESNIKASIEDIFVIKLESNASTGYSWDTKFDNNFLKLESHDYVQPKTNEMLCGAPGFEIWKFKALRKGKTNIEFFYLRPWEKNVKPVNSKKYKINIIRP